MKFKDLKKGMFLENKHVAKSSPNRYHEIIGIKENADGGKPYTDMWGGNVGETPKYTLIFQNMNGELTHFCFYSLEEDFDECIYKVIQNLG